jgi:adsorption protein B
MTASDVIAVCLVCAKVLLALVSVVFLISGVDDFFIDVFHALRSLWRRLFVMRRHRSLTKEHLFLPPEQPLAIMIPAWDESAVIRRMLESTLASVDYGNYRVFVGTYPNDAATQREVELVRERHDNVQRVVCPRDGPTSKADCLNWIWQGIQLYEKEHGVRFAAFLLHDSEDVLHPLSLRLFNYLVPRKDMVQLPVLPLEAPWHQFTAGHYLDEFAENHSKDMIARERLSGMVPSAGVGCAFSRRAMETMAARDRNQLFSVESLTEDYDFGFRLKAAGLKQVFVKQAIQRVTTRRPWWGGAPRAVTVPEYIATREYFPSRFRPAVRQKARWILGIALQGWVRLGWVGGGWTRYMLYRDRKALVTNVANVAGYAVVLAVTSVWVAQRLIPDAYRYPPLVEIGSWLWYAILANTFFLVVRLFQRALCVGRIYGWGQALLSMPRQVWGNVINFAAVCRAFALFGRSLVTGQRIAWDKTAHEFPSEAQMVAFRRKLGDLLLERRAVTVAQLEEALSRQREHPRPLGAILVEMGLVREDELVQVLGTQLRLSTREVDPYAVPLELLRLLPRELAVRHSVFPLEVRRGGRLVVAAERPLAPETVQALETALERPVEVCLSTRSDVAFGIQRGYARLEAEAVEGPALGRRLVERGLLSPAQLEQALKQQRRTYSRLGDVLLEERLMSPESLREALARFPVNGHPFGDFLVRGGYLSLEQLQHALEVQRSRFQRLGDVIVAHGLVSEPALRAVLEEQSPAA